MLDRKLTRLGVLGQIYSMQLTNSRKRGHSPPSYTLAEFRVYVIGLPNFESIYKEWQESGYDTDLRPSLDRLEDDKGYSFSNIKLVTWQENDKHGVFTRQVPIQKLCKWTREVKAEYVSITEASDKTKISRANLAKAIRTGGLAKGFKWQRKYNE